MRHFKDHPGNLIVNNQQLTLLAYADDLVLFGSSKQDIESKVNELVSIMDKIHLKFKPAKCGYFTLNIRIIDIQIYGEKISIVDKNNTYTYLGVLFGFPKGHTIKDILDSSVKYFTIISDSKLHSSQKLSAYKLLFTLDCPFTYKQGYSSNAFIK